MANPGERVTNVASTDDSLIVELADGRSISLPLAWYPRLLHASQDDRDHWQVAGAGFGVHWPAIDEDLCMEGLLRGAPAPRVRVVRSQQTPRADRPPSILCYAATAFLPATQGQR